MKEPSHPIEIFCTVSSDHLTKRGDDYHCRKCQKTLVNLNETAPNRTPLTRGSNIVCGFVSALTLAGCATQKEAPRMVGVQYSSDGIDRTNKEYPTAKWADEQKGVAISPYGGHPIDISNIPEGALVLDPSYPAKDRKLFRTPRASKTSGPG